MPPRHILIRKISCFQHLEHEMMKNNEIIELNSFHFILLSPKMNALDRSVWIEYNILLR